MERASISSPEGRGKPQGGLSFYVKDGFGGETIFKGQQREELTRRHQKYGGATKGRQPAA